MARGNPQQIALILRRKAQALERAIRAAEAESARQAVAIARSLSTGGLSREDLRRLGHPYRIGGRGVGDPALINLQAGSFYLGWRVVGPRKTPHGLQTSIVNDSPAAKFLLKGTRRMIARPILTRLQAKLKVKRMQLHRQALKAIHTGG